MIVKISYEAIDMYAIELINLTKTYNNGVQALKSLNLNIKQGDFFALLGANGAGKSTTIGLLSTLLNKTSGTIRIQGVNLDENPSKAKSYLGIVPQEFNLNVFETCEQVLINQAGFYGVPRKTAQKRAQGLLAQLNLSDKSTQAVRYLSGGMKRRLMIARALMHEPSILILDEPTAGVDIEIRRNMWAFLKQINEKGVTIILTTHYLEEAEALCKNVGMIHRGSLIEQSSIASLIASAKEQTFILNTCQPMIALPDLSPLKAQWIDPHHFELEIQNQLCLNDIFQLLDKHHLKIQSIRTKTNRLEALFMDRIQNENE